MLLFACSSLLTISTILTWFYILRIRIVHAYFLFFPIFIFYLTSISFFLSLTASLTPLYFLLLQTLIFLSTLTLLFHIRPHPQQLLRHTTRIFSYLRRLHFSIPSVIFTVTILLLIALSLWLRALTPTLSFDDVSYRASAPMHWIQNQSVFRFPSLTEHKNIFLFGTGIVYMWPNLFDTGETVANLLYWTAFPILIGSLYLLMSIFTQHKTFKLGAVLLFMSAPIIYENFTSILIQETWMGVVLISCVYILIKTIQNKIITTKTSILLGCIFGVLPLIKPTGFVYCLLLLVFLHTSLRKHIPSVILGFLISIFVSGYPVILYQNYQLYGSPSGSSEFSRIHIASFSPIQFITHTIRLPFALIKFPCYTRNCLTSVDTKIQTFASYIGATRVLEKESSESWIGIFKYLSSDPDRNFGFGGTIWFILMLLSFIDVYRILLKKQTASLTHLLFLIFSGIILLQIYGIRWEDASGVPYKHLIGAFPVACAFSFRLVNYIRNKKYYIFKFILYSVLLVSIIPLFLTTVTSIHAWSTDNDEKAIHLMRLAPTIYAPFLSSLHAPSSFLILEPSAPDYPLFWFQGHQKNTVYSMFPSLTSDKNKDVNTIQLFLSKQHIDYVIISGNPELSTAILNTHPFYTKTSLGFECTPIDIIHIL